MLNILGGMVPWTLLHTPIVDGYTKTLNH